MAETLINVTDSGTRDPESILKSPKRREQSSAAAIKLFLRITDHWECTKQQKRQLLGDVPAATFSRWENGKVGTLSRDQLERISYCLGIEKGLKLVFADEAGGLRWLKSANEDLPFRGSSPLDQMTDGGMSALAATRLYLDAWRGIK